MTTPSWSRSAVAMCLLLGFLGLLVGSIESVRIVKLPHARNPADVGFAIVGLCTGAAALATGLRGVRAWKAGERLHVVWYWPGLAACVLQGVTISGGMASLYFLRPGWFGAAQGWQVALVMLVGGGIPFLGALCCAGAWWVGRERDA